MKNRICLFVISILLTTTVLVAQDKSQVAVANAVEKLRVGMISGDKALLESLVAEKLNYGHSGGHVDDKAEFLDKLASGKSDFVTIELKDQTISISDNVAIVRHELHATTNDNNKPGDVHLRVLLIWQKTKGEWKLLARQAVKI